MVNSKIPDLFCRTCLQNLEKIKYNIFMMTHLSKWLSLCTSLNIEENDGLPKYLCDLCFMKIEDFYKFRTMCIESANKFHEMYENGEKDLNYHNDIDIKDNITTYFELEEPLTASNSPNHNVKDSQYYENDQKIQRENKEIILTYDISNSTNFLSKKLELQPQQNQQEIENQERKHMGSRFESELNILCEDLKEEIEEFQANNVENNSVDFHNNVNVVNNENNENRKDDEYHCDYDKDYKVRNKRKIKVKVGGQKKRAHVRSKSIKLQESFDRDNSIVDETGRKSQDVFICEICNKRYFKHEKYVACVRSHKGLKPWVCPECKKEYRKKESLRNHVKYEHNANCEMYPCPAEGCDKVYRLKQTMRVHYRRIHTKDLLRDVSKLKRSYICEQCGKSFKTLNALNQHRFIHTGEFPYKCEQCPKRCGTKYQLEVHMKRHKGIKNFICPICGLKKITQQELKTHMNYHSRDKTFTCKFCPYTSCNNGNVVRHERIVHHGIKTFECKYCGKTFGKAETLKHHVMTHTGEKPHECNLCGRRFIQPTALKTHLKRHDRYDTKNSKCLPTSLMEIEEIETTMTNTSAPVGREKVNISSTTNSKSFNTAILVKSEAILIHNDVINHQNS